MLLYALIETFSIISVLILYLLNNRKQKINSEFCNITNEFFSQIIYVK